MSVSTMLQSAAAKKWLLLGAVVAVVAVLAVFGARALLTIPAVAAFVERHPGVPTMPAETPVGIRGWLAVQHFLNFFLMVLLIRTGVLVRTTRRPKAYWTRHKKAFPRTKGAPTKISFTVWIHLWLNVIWMANGLVFIVLLIVTGQWMKVVPTSWDVFPNALSVGLQYLSFDWPTENGWIHYNALQLLTYFITIFIAAPLSGLTGLRISPAWSRRWERVSRIVPVEPARKLHFASMIYFAVFIVTHVALVLATGALRNLNHMFAARDDDGWAGLWLFLAALLVVALGWVVARPLFLKPVASLQGKVTAR